MSKLDEAKAEIEAMRRFLLRQSLRSRRVWVLLDTIQWSVWTIRGTACPCCGCLRENGHAASCSLARTMTEQDVVTGVPTCATCADGTYDTDSASYECRYGATHDAEMLALAAECGLWTCPFAAWNAEPGVENEPLPYEETNA